MARPFLYCEISIHFTTAYILSYIGDWLRMSREPEMLNSVAPSESALVRQCLILEKEENMMN